MGLFWNVGAKKERRRDALIHAGLALSLEQVFLAEPSDAQALWYEADLQLTSVKT